MAMLCHSTPPLSITLCPSEGGSHSWSDPFSGLLQIYSKGFFQGHFQGSAVSEPKRQLHEDGRHTGVNASD
jgi:hypothetical protein